MGSQGTKWLIKNQGALWLTSNMKDQVPCFSILNVNTCTFDEKKHKKLRIAREKQYSRYVSALVSLSGMWFWHAISLVGCNLYSFILLFNRLVSSFGFIWFSCVKRGTHLYTKFLIFIFRGFGFWHNLIMSNIDSRFN